MTPEDLARLRPYDPHFDDPFPPEPPPVERLSGWLAVATAVLAALFIGACIALGLR